MADDVIESVESLFLPRLERLAEELRRRFPDASFVAYGGMVGSGMEDESYDVAIVCVFPDIPPTQPADISLHASVCDLTRTPRIMAGVVWGHPSGHAEAVFREGWRSSISEWPEATPEVLQQLAEDLPRLIAAFEAAVERGRPSEAV
jgi:hypothetical protein